MTQQSLKTEITNTIIQGEARDLVTKAEHGTPEDLKYVHDHLTRDMANMSAKEYGQLLTEMQKDNAKDVSANNHLPTLEFYSGSCAGQIPDSVNPHYPDGDKLRQPIPTPNLPNPNDTPSRGVGSPNLPNDSYHINT